MCDNPASWLVLCIIAICFFVVFFAKVMNDMDERKNEAEDFWKNEYRR